MNCDKLSIISMNSSRRGHQNMAEPDRRSYLQHLLSQTKPQICLLPGDINEIDNAVIGYGAYTVPGNKQPVLLYDHQIVTMNKNVEINTFNWPWLDKSKIVCPMVEVMSRAPMSTVVKQFSLMTWHYTLSSSCEVSQVELMKSIVMYAQKVIMATRKPIIICGEMHARNVKEILNELNDAADMKFLDAVQPEMAKRGYSPEISKTAMKSKRNLFRLVVCKSNQTTTTNSEPIPDCFIASKDLELSTATFVDVEKVIGRRVEMKSLKEHCPTQTELNIPLRPPKHYGG